LEKELLKDTAAELKHSPSMKLPNIKGNKEGTVSQQLKQKKDNIEEHIRHKLVGADIPRSTSKNGSKYSQWKYPAKLN